MVVRRARKMRVWVGAALVAAGLGSVTPALAAGVFTTIVNFSGGPDGATPNVPVTPDRMGNLYGVTSQGGVSCEPTGATLGCGTLYKIDPSGKQTALYDFAGLTGYAPSTQLTLIGNALYGGTQYGGANGYELSSGYGVIFGVHTDGTGYTVLHNFNAVPDGAEPTGRLIPMGGGAGFYGIALYGGRGHNAKGVQRAGTLFALLANKTLIVLHSFNGDDGRLPNVLIQDQHGTLFGSTLQGGTACGSRNGCGTIFSYVPSTGVFTTLYQFSDRKDDALPYLGGIDASGVLYGTTGALGTVFQLAPAQTGYTFKTLFRFDRLPYGPPSSAPTLLPDGSLVGVTSGSGTGTGGVLYSLNSSRVPPFRDLHDFPGGGSTSPTTQPIVDGSDALYGTTSTGGPHCKTPTGSAYPEGCGTIYSYTVSILDR